MYCISCGTVLPDGSAFCTECGANQTATGNNVNQAVTPIPAPAPVNTMPQMKSVECEKKSASTPLVLSILSITLFKGLIGMILSIIAISQSKSLLQSKMCESGTYDMAKASKILGIIGLILNILSILASILVTVLYIFAVIKLGQGFLGLFETFPQI